MPGAVFGGKDAGSKPFLPTRSWARRGRNSRGLAAGWESGKRDGLNPSRPAEATSTPTVNEITGWRRALLAPLGWTLRLWGASLRFSTSPETEAWLRKVDEPVAFVLWHNRLFLASEIFRRYRQQRAIYGLVSASKDGAWLAAFFSLVGIRTVRGSSSRLGREAVSALVDVVRAGNDIGITPDGPRGPLYDFKAGATIVARRTRTPILLLGGAYERAWRLRSWDRFYLPFPFSRVRVYCQQVDPATLHDRDNATEQMRAQLAELNPDNTDQQTSRLV